MVERGIKNATTHLIASQDPERVDNLLSCVRVDVLASHKVEEGVELYEAGAVGVHDGDDALEVDVALLVLADGVPQGDQAGLELVRVQLAGPGSRLG